MNPHQRAAQIIIPAILDKIKKSSGIYTISLAGESGCGKTETSSAIIEELRKHHIKAIVLGQDNYFYLPPLANDAKRKQDASWLGPHKEVDLDRMDNTLGEASQGALIIEISHIDYDTNKETKHEVSLDGVKVIIAEGTYTSLLKHIQTRIFINANYHDTLIYRKLRNRGNEVNDPFVEGILETEHKIIAGHRFLADIIISKDYDVKFVN